MRPGDLQKTNSVGGRAVDSPLIGEVAGV